MAALSAISNFRNLEFVTRRVCCRAILLTWNRTKWFLKWWPSTILNFWNVHIWSCDCHRVLSLLLCTKSHENWMIFHWDMAIYRFSRWWPCGMLNFQKWELISCDLYRHAILLPCGKFTYSSRMHAVIGQPGNNVFICSVAGYASYYFRCVTSKFAVTCQIPNFIKITWFFVQINQSINLYGIITIFKMADLRYVEF